MCSLLVNETGITVSVDNQSESEPSDLERWGNVAATTLHGEGVASGHIDLVFVDVETMAQLNNEHMGGTGPTDVLAFPMDAPQLATGQVEKSTQLPGGPPIHLGDIVICPEVSNSQAAGHVGSVEGEFCLLTIHAALHLIGHDHVTKDERIAMQARERIYLAKFGFQHPVSEAS